MKKLLGIVVLSLLLGGNAYADENKWKVGENYLTAKCFIYEWTSSDNFKDYYKKLINTLEWLDDKNLNMDIAEKLIFTEFKKYILQYN